VVPRARFVSRGPPWGAPAAGAVAGGLSALRWRRAGR